MTEMPRELTLEGLFEGGAVFRPFAYYDKHLDVIRVQILDCSITEDRLDPIVTLYRNNHALAGSDNVVGFAIKGVRSFVEEFKLPSDATLKLAGLLDQLVQKYPTQATKVVAELYREMKKEIPNEVQMDLAA